MIYYGWVIVGAGIVATAIGQGAMVSLSIFLQPMSETMGWSRAGISAAAFVCAGSRWARARILWGALSDRFGTRAVVLSGGDAARPRHGHRQPRRPPCAQFQLLFGVLVGFAAGSFYAPMMADDHPLVHAATGASPSRSSRRGSASGP